VVYIHTDYLSLELELVNDLYIPLDSRDNFDEGGTKQHGLGFGNISPGTRNMLVRLD
jgi:hypothetical protein